MRPVRRWLAVGMLLTAWACGQSSPLGPETPQQNVPKSGEAPRSPKPSTSARPAASTPLVRVGIEVLEAEGAGALQGKKVGLVAHAASMTGDGHTTLDVLRKQKVEVVRLFAPEHGVAGKAAAGEKVKDEAPSGSELPVVSLYGDKTRPTAADLDGLGALVIDLQDAGARFYTYESTLILCLEAAAEAGLDVVVLDRPNPLGGERVEGPMADPKTVPPSLVSMAPGPLVHGLTLGEIAKLVNGRLPKPAHLTVVTMKGWARAMTWADTGRAWTVPSPNLRSAEAAIAYPGMCLLEATNVSEGRGTEEPFLFFGAPWTKSGDIVESVKVAGFALEPAAFTPTASDAAPEPKFKDELCAGVRVKVSDAKAARPYELGITLLQVLKRLHPEFQWRREGALDTLLGTRRVREALDRGDSVEAMLKADAPALEAWRKERAGALLY
jgi:uncharacterized protein YbbC (DUF1343 family)